MSSTCPSAQAAASTARSLPSRLAVAATPILASSLLDTPRSNTADGTLSPSVASQIWDLTDELDRGFIFEGRSGDDEVHRDAHGGIERTSVFTGGRAVGVSWMRSMTTTIDETDLKLSMREVRLAHVHIDR